MSNNNIDRKAKRIEFRGGIEEDEGADFDFSHVQEVSPRPTPIA